jgi:hypothetical protein
MPVCQIPNLESIRVGRKRRRKERMFNKIANNPTGDKRLSQIGGGRTISTVKPTESDLRDLEIICNHCTTFDSEGYFVNKVIMRHDSRNEGYYCEKCPRVVSEDQVRYAMRLELPEYHNYEKVPSKDNIEKINSERQHNEKFVIKAINSQSPDDLIKRSAAKVVNRNDKKTFGSR